MDKDRYFKIQLLHIEKNCFKIAKLDFSGYYKEIIYIHPSLTFSVWNTKIYYNKLQLHNNKKYEEYSKNYLQMPIHTIMHSEFSIQSTTVILTIHAPKIIRLGIEIVFKHIIRKKKILRGETSFYFSLVVIKLKYAN